MSRPLPDLAGAEDAGENGRRRGRPGHVVDHGQAEPLGWALGLAGERKEPRLGLHEVVETRPVTALAFASIGGDMGAHDLRIGGREVRVGEAELGGLITAQVVHEGVRRGNQSVQHRLAVRVFQIERQGTLVAIERLEDVRVGLAQEVGTAGPAGVASERPALDLDHIGTQVGEVAAGVGSRRPMFGGDDAQARQRQRHG